MSKIMVIMILIRYIYSYSWSSKWHTIILYTSIFILTYMFAIIQVDFFQFPIQFPSSFQQPRNAEATQYLQPRWKSMARWHNNTYLFYVGLKSYASNLAISVSVFVGQRTTYFYTAPSGAGLLCDMTCWQCLPPRKLTYSTLWKGKSSPNSAGWEGIY